jgi:hypothetical protein
MRRLASLARLNALLVGRFCMSLTSLKAVDFSGAGPKAIFYWRLFMQQLLLSCKNAGDVKEVFSRLCGEQAKVHATMIADFLQFVRTHFGPWLAGQQGSQQGPGGETVDSDELLRRLRVAEKSLSVAVASADAVGAAFK